MTITSRTEAASAATQGTGTGNDPFVFRDLSIVSTGDYAFQWTDPDADYDIRLENVRLQGAALAQILVDSGGALEIEHCALEGSPDSGGGIFISSGDVAVSATAFASLRLDGVRTLGAGSQLTVHLLDCVFSDEGGPWGTGAHGVQSTNSSGHAVVTIDYCDFSASSLPVGVRTWRDARYTISGSRFATQIGIRGGTEDVFGLRVAACVFETGHNAIRGQYFSDWEVAYCEFRDNDAGWRLARFDECTSGRVHHSRFTKTTGEGPGNECLESFDSAAIEFDHNWVTTCTEDAFEHVRPRDGCSVHHCVGDDVALQIVDFFGNVEGNAGTIHHIYGDCHDVGVLVTDVDNISIHDIFTDNSQGRWGNVTLEQRHTEPGTHPAGCSVRFPLPTASQSAEGNPFGTRGVVGPDNSAIWWINGQRMEFQS